MLKRSLNLILLILVINTNFVLSQSSSEFNDNISSDITGDLSNSTVPGSEEPKNITIPKDSPKEVSPDLSASNQELDNLKSPEVSSDLGPIAEEPKLISPEITGNNITRDFPKLSPGDKEVEGLGDELGLEQKEVFDSLPKDSYPKNDISSEYSASAKEAYSPAGYPKEVQASGQLGPEQVSVTTGYNDSKIVSRPKDYDGTGFNTSEMESKMFSPEIDTDQNSGNWVLKKAFWEQAEVAFGNIIDVNDSILKSQLDYFAGRNHADKQVEEILKVSGAEKSELVEFIKYLLDLITYTGSLSDLELKLQNLSITYKEKLETIQKDLNKLRELEASMDDSLAEVIKQIELCRDYEKKAWTNLKEIGQVLNDKKAKSLLYQVEGYLSNVNKIKTYVSGELQKYFSDLVEQYSKLVNSVVNNLEVLKRSGLDLSKELKFAKDLKAGLVNNSSNDKNNSKDDNLNNKNKKSKKSKKTDWLDSLSNFFKILLEILLFIPRKLAGLVGIKF